jgi:hypothetical protein
MEILLELPPVPTLSTVLAGFFLLQNFPLRQPLFRVGMGRNSGVVNAVGA